MREPQSLLGLDHCSMLWPFPSPFRLSLPIVVPLARGDLGVAARSFLSPWGNSDAWVGDRGWELGAGAAESMLPFLSLPATLFGRSWAQSGLLVDGEGTAFALSPAGCRPRPVTSSSSSCSPHSGGDRSSLPGGLTGIAPWGCALEDHLVRPLRQLLGISAASPALGHQPAGPPGREAGSTW